MDRKRILALTKKEEGPKLDFKLKLDISMDSGKKELAKDICAIANSKGGRGYLIIGIEDKTRAIIGVEEGDFNEEQIQQVVGSRCEPPIPISLEFVKVEDKTIGVITVYDGPNKPYQCRENGAFYIRRGSTTDTMRKQEIISALENNFSISIELCPIIRSDISILDLALVDKYFNSIGLQVDEENRLGLMENAAIIHLDRESNRYSVTLGGLLVFSHVNSMCVPYNMIRIVNKINKDYDEISVIKGNLIDILDKSEELLYGILPKTYPIEAVYESVKNAVLYRDYSIYNKEIEVVICSTSVSVISPGILINSNNFTNHQYYKRNMWIYEKLIAIDDKARFTQSRRGFNKMKVSFRSYGKVMFINSMENNVFKVIFPAIKKINSNSAENRI